ncbi:MAG: ChaN family lipoprotein [Alphaproteobacteria bacterium]|nr:ChaN family lipoprotein [Alphaproteobacteria bacterium]
MIALLAAAHAGDCAQTTLADLAETPGPAVFVLGERRGTQPDLGRAARLVARLRASGEPVTVALQAVQADKQPVLDRYGNGEVALTDLPGLLDWQGSWGFPWTAYQRLVTGAIHGDRVVGVGLPLERQPEGAIAPRPPGYIQVLSDAMSGHYMPPQLEPAFVQTVSWLDHRTALEAMQNWSGEGYLVVVADRLHVEGGKGIGWQLQRLVEAPVASVLLGGPGACYDGDLYLGAPSTPP